MPVVGRGDGDGIDGLVVQHLADVAEGRYRGQILALQLSVITLRVRIVDIDERGELDVRLRNPGIHVAGTASAASHHGNAHRIIRAAGTLHHLGGRRAGRAHHKTTTVHKIS